MGFTMKHSIKKNYLQIGTKRRGGTKMPRVGFIVAHDTGNKNSTAAGNVGYYKNSANTMSASAHLFVDDKEIIECIPALTAAPEKAWHVLYNRTEDNIKFGDDANDIAIGVELCYGDNINFDKAYDKYVWTIAYICYKFKLNPANRITGHQFLDPGRKTDPTNALRTGDVTFNQLVKDVVKMYNACCKGSGGSIVLDTDAEKHPVTELNRTVTVTTDSLNVRKGASLSEPIVGTLKKGSKVTAKQRKNGMYHIGKNQWISSSAVYVKYKNNPTGTATILSDSLTIREKASFDSKDVGILKKGKTVKVYEKQNGLYHIGKNKWISASTKYIKFVEAPSKKKNNLLSIGKAVVLVDELNVRTEADASSKIVSTKNKGAVVKVYEIKSNWYRIGTKKWISGSEKYVKFKKK